MQKIGNNKIRREKNMKKQGFTLIELLAVIVILAVIALIATPLVMSTINDAKEGALKSTVRSIKEEAEKLYVKKVQLNPSENPTVTESEIEYSGDQIPTEDMKVTFNNSGLANIAIYKDSKCVYKFFNDSDVTVNKTWTKEECLNSVLLGADMLVSKANGSDVTVYNNGNKGEMYTFNQPATEQLEATTDYRYIGNVPNNYITFNNEMWRIIGVFGNNVKIIKDAAISDSSGNTLYMYRDYKKGTSENPLGSSVSEHASNDWTDSQLMYMLNPTTYSLKQGYTLNGNYIKDTNGNIIYEIGKRPALVEMGTTEYTGVVETWKLSDVALELVETTTYYLGGITWKNSTNPWGNVATMYSEERGTNVASNRSINWVGKVGLMYSSDYGYTYAYGVNDACYNNLCGCRTEGDYIGLPETGWLYNNQYQWTIDTYAGSLYFSLRVGAIGDVDFNISRLFNGVRPTVYLRSDVLLTGTGTEADPYKILG